MYKYITLITLRGSVHNIQMFSNYFNTEIFQLSLFYLNIFGGLRIRPLFESLIVSFRVDYMGLLLRM